MNDDFVELDELFNIFAEIEARYSTNNLVFLEYQSLSWADLCNKGIDLLKKLRDE